MVKRCHMWALLAGVLLFAFLGTPLGQNTAGLIAHQYTDVVFKSIISGSNLDTTAGGGAGPVAAAAGLSNYGPRAMVTIGMDLHQNDPTAFTMMYPLETQYRLPTTYWVQKRSGDVDAVTNDQLTTMALNSLTELGNHTTTHLGGMQTYSRGQINVAGTTILGYLANFLSAVTLDVGDYIAVTRMDTVRPKRITVITDTNTLTYADSTDMSAVRMMTGYALFVSTYHVGTVSTTAGSPIITGSGTTWLTNGVTNGIVPARGSGKGSMVLIEAAQNASGIVVPFYVSTVDSNTQITLSANVANTLSGASYGIMPSAYEFKDDVADATSYIRTAIGNQSYPVVSYAAPLSQWGKWWEAPIREAGITSAATAGNNQTSSFNFPTSSFDPFLVHRFATFNGMNTIEDAIAGIEATIDMQAYTVFNFERMFLPESQTGAVSTNDGSTVTGSGTTMAADGVSTNDWIFIRGASRPYKIASRLGEVLTLAETMETADQNLSGKTFYVETPSMQDCTIVGSTVCAAQPLVAAVYQYLDSNRQRVLTINQADAVKRMNYTGAARSTINELPNPKFRVTLATDGTDLFPTGNTRHANWRLAVGDYSRISVDSSGDLVMDHTSGSADDSLIGALPYVEDDKVYEVTGIIDLMSVTGTPTILRINVQGLHCTNGVLNLIPNTQFRVVGQYPFKARFDTRPCDLYSVWAGTETTGNSPTSQWPTGTTTLNSKIATGQYEIKHPPIDGNARGMVTSRADDVHCAIIDISNTSQLSRVFCRTIGAAPAYVDAPFDFFIPANPKFSSIGGDTALLSIEFNGQGKAAFRNLLVREAATAESYE